MSSKPTRRNDGSGRPAIVLLNGTVRCLDAADTVAEAVAVVGERVHAVGARDEVLAAAGQGAQQVDLAGGALVPGFTDAHLHLEHGEQFDRRLDGVASLAALTASLEPLRSATPVDGWISLEAELHDDWLDPDAVELACSDRPTVLALGAGRYLLNRRAAAEFDQDLAHDDGAVVEWSEGGGARVRTRGENRIKALLPRAGLYTVETAAMAIATGGSRLAAGGVTALHHIVKDSTAIRAHEIVAATADVRPRAGLILRIWESEITLDAAVQLAGDRPDIMQGVKISIDGYHLNGTAGLSRSGSAEREPNFRIGRSDLEELVVEAHRHDLRVCLHANGDVAVDAALDAFSKAQSVQPRRDHRHRIEHFGNVVLSPAQIDRARRLGVVAVVNPPTLFRELDKIAPVNQSHRYFDPLALRTMLDRGLLVAVGSDSIAPTDPLHAIAALVSRTSDRGNVYSRHQAIRVEDALRLYTQRGAWLSFAENERGMIAPGLLADFAWLSGDPLSCPPAELAQLSVVNTMIGGCWAM